jgi:hypothetical protein
MKGFLSKAFLAVAATATITLLPVADADAHGGRWRGRVGVYLGAPIIAAPWYYPSYAYPAPYYYPPMVREEPTVYIEQGAAPSTSPAPVPQAQAPAQQQYWYYCPDSQTYYPHVQNCASPWQRVIPQPPAQP